MAGWLSALRAPHWRHPKARGVWSPPVGCVFQGVGEVGTGVSPSAHSSFGQDSLFQGRAGCPVVLPDRDNLPKTTLTVLRKGIGGDWVAREIWWYREEGATMISLSMKWGQNLGIICKAVGGRRWECCRAFVLWTFSCWFWKSCIYSGY